MRSWYRMAEHQRQKGDVKNEQVSTVPSSEQGTEQRKRQDEQREHERCSLYGRHAFY